MAIAIVGGGISGLALGVAALERGLDPLVFEASPRPGGKIGTHARDGYLLEKGPNGFLENEPATLALVGRLGLTDKLRRASDAAKRRFLFTRGALREVPASPKFLVSDVLSLGGRLRLLAEPFSGRGPNGDESVASFMRRHLGAEATAVLIDAVQSGIYAGDPERLSISAAFPKLKALEREYRSLVLGMMKGPKSGARRSALCSFEGGLETLVTALALRLGPRVKCNARVAFLAPADGGWSLRIDVNGVSETVSAGQVVLGLPAFAAAPLVQPFSPQAAAELAAIPYAPVAVVHLGFARQDVPNAPEGFGVLVPHAEGRPTLGILYISSFYPWRAPAASHLFTVMLGGARHPEVLERDEASLRALAQEELKAILGITAAPELAEAVKWERAIPQYEVGHADRVARAESALARWPGLFLGGNAYRGVGINDCVRNTQELAARLAA